MVNTTPNDIISTLSITLVHQYRESDSLSEAVVVALREYADAVERGTKDFGASPVNISPVSGRKGIEEMSFSNGCNILVKAVHQSTIQENKELNIPAARMATMDLDEKIGRVVFGFSDEVINNRDLAHLEYSEDRRAAGRVVAEVYSSSPVIREKFNRFIGEWFDKAKFTGGSDEFLLIVTPDVICEAALHAFM